MDTEAIREELKTVRDEIKSLKSKFNSKKNDKEALFTQGEQYSQEINQLYEEVKKIEEENNLDKINEDLEEKKKEFDEIKGSFDELDKKFVELKKQNPLKKSDSSQRPKVRTISLDKAKQEIAKLELKLQTQVLNLEKESQLIKKIAELKDLISSHSPDEGPGSSLESGNSIQDDEFKTVRKDLRSVKKKYVGLEKKIRSLYKQIRLISKEKKQRYKRIDELRDLKKKSFEEFREEKKDYSELGKNLKSLFKKEDDLLEQLGESPSAKKKFFDKSIKQKQKEVEDKVLKGGVLTTEDLLAFQRK